MDAKIHDLLGGVPAIEIIDFLIEERKLTLRELEDIYTRLRGRHRSNRLDDPWVDRSHGCHCRECKG